jgi:hypothetical protein
MLPKLHIGLFLLPNHVKFEKFYVTKISLNVLRIANRKEKIKLESGTTHKSVYAMFFL